MRALVFDTETSGLIENSLVPMDVRPSIIEFYGAVVEDGEVVEELEFLCDPGFKISEEITRITGITNADLAGKPRFKHFADDVAKLVRSCQRLVAHNLKFDLMMIDTEMIRADRLWSAPPDLICTVESSEWYKGYRLNLSGLHEHLFGKTFEGAHRAKVDVQALIRCYNEMVKRGDI